MKLGHQKLSKRDQADLIELLRQFVTIQTGTGNTAGIRKIQELGRRQLEDLGFETQLIETTEYGPHLIAQRLRSGRPRIVLDGHVDTVFPHDSNPHFRIQGDRCFGQGVIDMKGGNVCMIGALRLLHQSGLLDELSLRVVLVSDEEVGSPSSRSLIARLAPESDVVLVFEEAGSNGEVVVGRSGIQVTELRCRGVAGHAGNVKGVRRNAIEELSYKICSLREAAYSLTADGILFSVGTVSGGIAHNVIAESASCLINIRFSAESAFRRLREMFEAIVAIPHIPGTSAELCWHDAASPAMPVTERAMLIAQFCSRAGQKLGYDVGVETRGGTSNANLWAQAGTVVIDGLGPIGGDDHSDREWMQLTSLFNRVELVANLLVHLSAEDGLRAPYNSPAAVML